MDEIPDRANVRQIAWSSSDGFRGSSKKPAVTSAGFLLSVRVGGFGVCGDISHWTKWASQNQQCNRKFHSAIEMYREWGGNL